MKAKNITRKKKQIMPVSVRELKSEAEITLSPGHLLQLEKVGYQVRTTKLEMNVNEQSLVNKILNRKVLDYEIRTAETHRNSAASTYESKINQYHKLVEDLKREYGIKTKGLGYNPTTGVITQKDYN